MRTKVGTIRKKRHKKILKLAKGYWMTRHKRFKVANEAVMHAGQYAFHGRKLRKRDMRRLWIVRLNATLTTFKISYSKFIKLLKDKKIELNRKILSEVALNDPTTFKEIVNFVK
ncbi:50S ribosomal protein L20 [Patescibacteria group bacterium]|nr:50S ribosomal protein L20 [Patescibacteria group bacterium]